MIFFFLLVVLVLIAQIAEFFIPALPWLYNAHVYIVPVIVFYGAMALPFPLMLALALYAGILLDVLTVLGVHIAVLNIEEKNAELVGTVQVTAPAEGLRSTTVNGALAAQLIDETGATVSLGHFFTGKPVVLVFDYLRCRTICGVLLGNLADATGGRWT